MGNYIGLTLKCLSLYMQRVERHIAIGNKRLDELCFLSKNLYNYVNYLIRQELTQNKKFCRNMKLLPCSLKINKRTI